MLGIRPPSQGDAVGDVFPGLKPMGCSVFALWVIRNVQTPGTGVPARSICEKDEIYQTPDRGRWRPRHNVGRAFPPVRFAKRMKFTKPRIAGDGARATM